MARWYGSVGFAESKETKPGVWTPVITERTYFGEIIQNFRKLESSDQVNDDVNVSNKISIVADPYAEQNFHKIRYAEFMGAKWKVGNVEVQRPRLILTLGGVWNGKQA